MSQYVCYCCGEPLGDPFALVSYRSSTDRVFLFKPEHVGRVDVEAVVVKVRRDK